MTNEKTVLASSFRDPSGFVFTHRHTLYRQVNLDYQQHYDLLMASGLYRELSEAGWLIPHQEVPPLEAGASDAYKVIKPERVPFISYPYEWSFSQLKDAALLTLQIQRRSLQSGMSLKDASAYNVQFVRGRPVLIDTLSFEGYEEGRPWVAYQQFCRHFLAPLALMSYCHPGMGRFLRVHLDGIPLDLTSRLLPLRTRFRFPLLVHLHLHSRAQKRYAARKVSVRKTFGKLALGGLVNSLESAIRSLRWRPVATGWLDYYENNHYSEEAVRQKERFVSESIRQCSPKPGQVWDLGANTGLYSRIACAEGIDTVAFDLDPSAVEVTYLNCVREKQTRLLPLLLDLANPSPAVGWMHEERMSLCQRGPVDVVLALALVHHLALTHNLPLGRIASFLAQIGRRLVIEFVPKEDSQAGRLLANREDIFPSYQRVTFEKEFSRHFVIRASTRLDHSERILYCMDRLVSEDHEEDG
jgi:hypothetical protein